MGCFDNEKGSRMTEPGLPVAVVTDSVATIPPALVATYGLEVVPYELIWDGQAYRDGIDITPTEFYQRFRTSETRPTTVSPTLSEFTEVYERVAPYASGIVGVFVSRALTHTAEVATLAAESSPVPVRVIDSGTATIAEGFIALEASRAAHRGANLEEVAATAERARARTGFVASLQTLEHLVRGGRGGQVARLLNEHIHVEPIVTITDGKVAPVGVARSHARAAGRMLEAMRRFVDERPIRASVMHADLPDEAEALAERVRSMFHCTEFFVSELTPVVGVHTGPAVLGIAYCIEDTA